MRKILAILTLVFTSTIVNAQANDPVIMTINGENVYQSEFLYIYTKNNQNPSFKKKDLDAYMELFINYKLKVKEAESLKYDTIPKLVDELKQYRGQLSLPYMIDKEKNEALIKEAYERTLEEVRASHILIRLTPEASPEDTLAAYNKALKLRDRIIAGEEFAKVAKGPGGSEDPSAKTNGGDLGYFTALQMVYPFEEAAYKTPVGDISMPVRTRFGYHIIKVFDKRKSQGKISAAHIMILTNDDVNKEEQMKAKEKIDEIYALLEKGESFEDLAMKYSDDQSSKNKGGVLPTFGAGTRQRMVPAFEEAAYKIANDGDYSEPVKTPYGWHIIKRIKLEPMPTYEEMYRELKLKVERDVRAEQSKQSFIDGLKKEYGFVDNYGKYKTVFEAEVTDDIFNAKWKGLASSDKLKNEILFSFADQGFSPVDFENYLKETQRRVAKKPIWLFVKEQYDIFVNLKISEYEDGKLEEKHPDFKALMKEYRDGILVFEIMQNEIWEKAALDTTGIKNYYETNKEDFKYPVRFQGDLYKCKDKATAATVYSMLESDTIDPIRIRQTINKDSQLNLTVKSHTFNSQTTDALKKGKKARKFKKGLNKAYKYNDEYYVFDVKEVFPPRARKFAEAKGLVTAAYQNELEKEWLADLRTKYNVVVNNDVLYNSGKSK